jgi:hypothetical protein
MLDMQTLDLGRFLLTRRRAFMNRRFTAMPQRQALVTVRLLPLRPSERIRGAGTGLRRPMPGIDDTPFGEQHELVTVGHLPHLRHAVPARIRVFYGLGPRSDPLVETSWARRFVSERSGCCHGSVCR